MDIVSGVVALASVRPIAVSSAKLLEQLLGKPFSVAGELMADEIYGWQTVNRIRWADKVRLRLEKSSVKPEVLPKGFLMPIIEAVGNVEDDYLQECWAKLTTSGLEQPSVRSPIFAEALKRLTAEDAKLFEAIAARNDQSHDYQDDQKKDVFAGRLLAVGLLEHFQFGETEKKVEPWWPQPAKDDVLHMWLNPPQPDRVHVYTPAARISMFGAEFYRVVCRPEPKA